MQYFPQTFIYFTNSTWIRRPWENTQLVPPLLYIEVLSAYWNVWVETTRQVTNDKATEQQWQLSKIHLLTKMS